MTIFKKILDGEIPCNKVYEDDLCLAFHDVAPQAPVHILIIPKITEIDKLSNANESHKELLGHMMLKAKDIAAELGLEDFRFVVNNGEGAGQTVFHLHLHILGGRDMAWPPG